MTAISNLNRFDLGGPLNVLFFDVYKRVRLLHIVTNDAIFLSFQGPRGT